MIGRLVLTLAALAPWSPTIAGPYLVQFLGTVTEIDEVAPDSFWIGEKVAGAFVYDPDVLPVLTSVTTFQVVDTSTPRAGDPPTGWPTNYSDFPTNDSTNTLSHVFPASGLMLETEGDFAAIDQSSDIVWLGSYSDISTTTATFGGDGSSFFQLANLGRLANLLLDDEVVESSLQTLSGRMALRFS